MRFSAFARQADLDRGELLDVERGGGDADLVVRFVGSPPGNGGIIILATDSIGLAAIVTVGMGLVGGVAPTPDEGAELYKGEEFGLFQFGGSDVIMVFQKDKVEITATLGQRYLQGQEIGMRLEAR